MNIKNELIVEFLELRKCQLCDNNCMGYYCNSNGEPTESNMFLHELNDMEFHSNWRWLMPVVERIESIWHDDHGYFGVFISANSCTIQGTKFRPDASIVEPVYYNNLVLGTKIESTYQCVIRFIDWYLKKHKKQMMLEQILEYYNDEEELLKADGFDEAIIGVVEDFNAPPRIAYSVKKCIEILINGNDYFDAMSDIDAMEYFSYNVSGAYVGEKTPIWVQDDFE